MNPTASPSNNSQPEQSEASPQPLAILAHAPSILTIVQLHDLQDATPSSLPSQKSAIIENVARLHADILVKTVSREQYAENMREYCAKYGDEKALEKMVQVTVERWEEYVQKRNKKVWRGGQ